MYAANIGEAKGLQWVQVQSENWKIVGLNLEG